MDAVVTKNTFWIGKRVFITGHTGFKGGWLALWLSELGADVHGYALEPPTDPNFYTVTCLERRLASHTVGDIRNLEGLQQAVCNARPEVVFHLAAQPLVRYSYQEPVDTYTTNVIGTINLLEAVRHCGTARSIVNITTDKCYENREWVWPYRENEALGGYDPYSSSKACAEIVSTAWRRSFLAEAGIHLATARAGNVIGGGDWARDRLLPDFLRALNANQPLTIRSPKATRPWQHVLEPLSGYLRLAEALYEQGGSYAEAWNFGPDDRDSRPVEWICEYLCNQVEGATWQCDTAHQPHEANALKLDSSKAKNLLGWQPRWSLEQALSMTLSWHNAWRNNEDMAESSIRQIQQYEADWAAA